MDEIPAAEASVEDGSENSPPLEHTDQENNENPTAEDTPNDRDAFFCCDNCGEVFGEEDVYLEHCKQHMQEASSSQDQLHKLYDGEKDSEAAYFCTVCSASFVEPSELHSHMEDKHGQTSQQQIKQTNFKCPDCGKCYVTFGHFLNHQRTHLQASKSILSDLEGLKKKSFQCETCGRSYSRASALEAHRRCHEEKLIRPRKFSEADLGAEDKPREAPPPPKNLFHCACGKSFAALFRLKAHQRFSRKSECCPEESTPKLKKNEFFCTQCDKVICGKLAVYNHKRSHENAAVKVKDTSKKFICDKCGKPFVSLSYFLRHQRIMHSEEAPAKSFLHQVCQLQKKAFQCEHCGLKFSRASALHSHELIHTDTFREVENGISSHSPPVPHLKKIESGARHIVCTGEKVRSETLLETSITAEYSQMDESDEEMESYEPGDFNVQVISPSESEDDTSQDPNPDLELVCESDQEFKDEPDTAPSSSGFLPKPGMNLNIVQVDMEQTDEHGDLMEDGTVNGTMVEKYDCPECYRWFTSAASLRGHSLWHRINKTRRQIQGQSVADTHSHDGSSDAAHGSHTQHDTQITKNNNEMCQAERLEDTKLTCNECGIYFSNLSALISHQSQHPKRKQFQCPDCMMTYFYEASLFKHMKKCSARKEGGNSVAKKEYNPKKNLLGPKIYSCEQCGKGFWSLGAYSHHRQNQKECADLKQRKGSGGSLHSVSGRPRSSVMVACPVCGRKFRHKGIMTLHMRKHENGNHKCELCNRSFRLFSSLLRHQVVHSDQLLPPPIKSFEHQVEQLKKNTYSCPDCGKLFSRAKALQFHMKSHGYETGRLPPSPTSKVKLEALQCPTCLAHFSSKASLRAHQKLCSKRDNITVDCKTEPVEKNSTHTSRVNVHKISEAVPLNKIVRNEAKTVLIKIEDKTGETDLKYKCKKCNKSFSVVGALNLHSRIHAKRPAGKAKLAMLKKYKQEESGEGLFHSSEGGRTFLSNSALNTHKLGDTEETFSPSTRKEENLKAVCGKTEDGTFQCNMCGKQFFNSFVFQRHQMLNPQCRTKTAPAADSSSSSLDTFSCPECKKTFVEVSLLEAHYEAEHGKTLVASDPRGDWVLDRSEFKLSPQKGKLYHCSVCSMTFAKARGLHTHEWQAHFKRTEGKHTFPSCAQTESFALSSQVRKTENSSSMHNSEVTVAKNSPLPLRSITCLDCGIKCSSADTLIHHRNECEGLRQQEVSSLNSTAEGSPPPIRPPDQSVKYLFKCPKCGKAFQTEGQLQAHKTKAKSRPFCCALCCHGFWTETQLQQHLVWHDEVRCRLPNELRFRLSATVTPRPLKTPSPSPPGQSTLTPEGHLQSGHKCHHCGKAFLSPAALHKHESQHCNSDSYHCSICPRTFSQIQDLINHHQECIGDYRRQSEAPATTLSGKTNGLSCLECGTAFLQQTDLHQHYLEHARGM